MNKSVYERLVIEYNRQSKALNEENESVNLCEYKYLTNCLDCMEYMDQNYKIDLDCSEVSLEVIDILFENAHIAYKEGNFDHLDLFVDMFSGYVAMVFKNELGGEFVYDEHGEALDIQSNPLYIHEMVRCCIVSNLKIEDEFMKIKNLV